MAAGDAPAVGGCLASLGSCGCIEPDLIVPHIARAKFLAQFAAPTLPPVIGHRGAAAHAPENTLASFRLAKALGCSWVEFDVRLTADGVPVVCHDARLDRTTTGTGLISQQSFAAVRECDAGVRFDLSFAGERVPTLGEVLALAHETGLGANIELKADRGREHATAAAVAETLATLNGRLPAVLVSSFQPGAIGALHSLRTPVGRGILFRVLPRDWSEIAVRLDCGVIGVDHRSLRRRRVAEIRDAGYQLAAYTVNNPSRARLLYSWGVTSVFSDAPDVILNVIPGRGLAASVPYIPAVARQGATG